MNDPLASAKCVVPACQEDCLLDRPYCWSHEIPEKRGFPPRSPKPSKLPRKRAPSNKKYGRASVLKKYGLCEADYQAMVVWQCGACLICKKVKPLVVDHDHATGKVRGLLCSHCNSALGFLMDDPTLVDEAAQYLRSHTVV